MAPRHVLLTIVALCTGTSVVAQAPVVRDSAGIRIVENPARATAPVVFRLGPQSLDIGGAADKPDDELSRGRGKGALRLADGTVAVPDAVRVQFFDAQGRRVGMVGRAGAGPSEFRSLASGEFCRTRGDTLVVGDLHNGRFAVIHQQRVVRTTAYTNFGGGMVGCFDDGTVLMANGWFGGAPTYSIHVNRPHLDGTLATDYGDFVFRTPSVFSHSVTPTITAFGQRMYMGDGATSEVRVYSAVGKLVQIIRTADTPKPITAADVQRELSRRPPNARDEWHSDAYPTYQRFRLDPEGRMWIQDFISEAHGGQGWTAFDADGRLIGRLEAPRMIGQSPATVAGFGVNEVQIERTDDDGFVHLTFYPIVRVQR